MIRKGQTQRDENSMISKFASTEEIHVVVAGGPQGGSRSRVLEPRETGGSRSVTRPMEQIN